jgi:hypothetical protein
MYIYIYNFYKYNIYTMINTRSGLKTVLTDNLGKLNNLVDKSISKISPYKTNTPSNTSNTSNKSVTSSKSGSPSLLSSLKQSIQSILTPNRATGAEHTDAKHTDAEHTDAKHTDANYNDRVDGIFPKPLEMSSIKSPNTSIPSLDNSIDKLNVAEIKTMLTNISKTIERIAKTASIASVMSATSVTPSGVSFSKLLTMLIIVLIIIFLGLNLYTFLNDNENAFVWLSKKLNIPNMADKIATPIDTGVSASADLATELVKETTNIDISTPSTDTSEILEKHNSGGKKSDSKLKYCFIGKNKGVRSCIKILNDDECSSNNIFPTMDVCINPKLRV